MRLGLILLCAGYVLSQFFRAFLAVLTRVLEQDVGAGPEDLAFASGLWFLTFAAATHVRSIFAASPSRLPRISPA